MLPAAIQVAIRHLLRVLRLLQAKKFAFDADAIRKRGERPRELLRLKAGVVPAADNRAARGPLRRRAQAWLPGRCLVVLDPEL